MTRGILATCYGRAADGHAGRLRCSGGARRGIPRRALRPGERERPARPVRPTAPTPSGVTARFDERTGLRRGPGRAGQPREGGRRAGRSRRRTSPSASRRPPGCRRSGSCRDGSRRPAASSRRGSRPASRPTASSTSPWWRPTRPGRCRRAPRSPPTCWRQRRCRSAGRTSPRAAGSRPRPSCSTAAAPTPRPGAEGREAAELTCELAARALGVEAGACPRLLDGDDRHAAGRSSASRRRCPRLVDQARSLARMRRGGVEGHPHDRHEDQAGRRRGGRLRRRRHGEGCRDAGPEHGDDARRAHDRRRLVTARTCRRPSAVPSGTRSTR